MLSQWGWGWGWGPMGYHRSTEFSLAGILELFLSRIIFCISESKSIGVIGAFRKIMVKTYNVFIVQCTYPSNRNKTHHPGWSHVNLPSMGVIPCVWEGKLKKMSSVDETVVILSHVTCHAHFIKLRHHISELQEQSPFSKVPLRKWNSLLD